MARATRSLDPQIISATKDLLLARPDGVARQEVSGRHNLDASTARRYLRAAGAHAHGGRGARWRLPAPPGPLDADPGAAGEQGGTVAADAKTHRSDVPDRRARLRRLDIPLGSEFEDGGAMMFTELRRHVVTRNLLGVPASDATLWEWWSYACRRRFIERDEGMLYRLSPDARRDIATRRAEESLKVTPTVRALTRSATPAGWLSLVIASAALASTNPTSLAAVGAFLVGLALAGCVAVTVDFVLGERADARLDRRVLSRHVAWLDGGPLPRLFLMRGQPAVPAGSMRRLETPPQPALDD